MDNVSPSALALREREHGGADAYAAQMKKILDELEQCPEYYLVGATIGANKAGRKLDRDALTWMALEVIKYRRRFPKQETKHEQPQYKAWKQSMNQRREAMFPDLSADNRVFSSKVAEMKWNKVSCHPNDSQPPSLTPINKDPRRCFPESSSNL